MKRNGETLSQSKWNTRNSKLTPALVLCACLLGNQAKGQMPDGGTKQPTAQGLDKPSPSSEQSKLVDGLLDLLEEPATDNKGTQPDLGSNSKSDETKSPDELNTLSMVRKRMDRAASLLQEGKNDRETIELQTSIVSQLDQLIARIEQQQKSEQKSSKQRMQQTMQQQVQQKSQQQNNVAEKLSSSPSPNKNSSETGEAGKSPGNQGETVDAGLRRNDPTALQQNVWGHLPERVRSQMQSRMVEEFLPAYREHIEAYYRALLEEGNRK